jgi:hypothetical protein
VADLTFRDFSLTAHVKLRCRREKYLCLGDYHYNLVMRGLVGEIKRELN